MEIIKEQIKDVLVVAGMVLLFLYGYFLGSRVNRPPAQRQRVHRTPRGDGKARPLEVPSDAECKEWWGIR